MKGKVFTAQQVQSMIAGDMTMFREVCKKQPQGEMQKPYVIRDMGIGAFHYPFGKCPYQIGQKIFCKESFDPEMEYENEDDLDFRIRKYLAFKADFYPEDHCLGKWRPAQHMKQEHSRLTPLIKEIKVERLQEISEEDVKKEGFKTDYKMLPYGIFKKDGSKFFIENWNATHKKPEEKFEANPWVWIVEFKKMD